MAVDDKAQPYISKTTKAHILSDVFWDRLNGVLKLLQPILSWITKVEADTPQISLVAKIFCKLDKHLSAILPESPLTKSEEKAAKTAVADRKDFCLKAVPKAANLLDPHYVGQHLSEDDALDACELISKLLKVTLVCMKVMSRQIWHHTVQEPDCGRSNLFGRQVLRFHLLHGGMACALHGH